MNAWGDQRQQTLSAPVEDENIPNVDDLGKRLLGSRIFTLPKHDGEFGQHSDLERRLYLIDGIAMGGLPEPQAVVRQCAVFVLVRRHSGIAVIEVVEG